MRPEVYIKRREHKYRQEDVAKLLNISKNAYFMKEKGNREFTIHEGLLLSKIYGCSLDDLFTREVRS